MAITRFRNSSILNRGPKYNDFLAGLPFRPIIGTATDGGTGTTVSVAFTGNNPAGAGITYTALSSPGNFTATGPASPITVSGLTAGTAYTFQVKAGNSLGDSAYSSASNSVTPVQPTAFESIATATGTGSNNSITFDNIPGTYQHLQLRLITKDTSTTDRTVTFAYPIVTFNSVATSTYDNHYLYGNGTSAIAGASINQTGVAILGCYMSSGASFTNMVGASIIDIHDYASTSKNKTVRYISGTNDNTTSTNRTVTLGSGLWRNTNAITRIDISAMDTAWSTSTVIALYGIKG